MGNPTNAELRDEIRELLGVSEHLAGSGQLRSRTLETAVERLGGTPWGGAPSLRQTIREELDLSQKPDPSAFRKADLVTLRDALQEAETDD